MLKPSDTVGEWSWFYTHIHTNCADKMGKSHDRSDSHPTVHAEILGLPCLWSWSAYRKIATQKGRRNQTSPAQPCVIMTSWNHFTEGIGHKWRPSKNPLQQGFSMISLLSSDLSWSNSLEGRCIVNSGSLWRERGHMSLESRYSKVQCSGSTID